MPRSSNHCPSFIAAIVLIVGGIISLAEAGVVVLANRSDAKVDFSVTQADGTTSQHSLAVGDVLPVPAEEKLGVAFMSGDTPQRVLLGTNSIHYFMAEDGTLDLLRVKLADGPARPATERPATEGPAPEEPVASRPVAEVFTVPVMLLVDDEEPMVRRIWEKRLRDRLEAASKIIESHCRVRFEVAAVGTWESDDRVDEFDKTLREFEMTVKPAPARLAIGFTSQYKLVKGNFHLGGTRGTLHPYVLIREWSHHITKTERLEVLVHELGHYLGATHCAESNSVMRPKLGDHQSHARSFRIGFDPVNTYIMYQVGEELRTRPWSRGFTGLPDATRGRLREAYLAMDELMPEDSASKNFVKLLDYSPRFIRRPTSRQTGVASKPLVQATQAVVQAVVEAAEENTSLAEDQLTERYIRKAAATAASLKKEVAAKAFLLGLGIALDNSAQFRYMPPTGPLCRQVESNEQRRHRLSVLGLPTMQGRRDLAKHFVVSAALTSLVGRRAAVAAGIGKELRDARGRSGFSFADLTADMAGASFASALLQEKITLSDIASDFSVADFLGDPDGLEEGIAWKELQKRYGSAQDDRFHREQAALLKKIQALPGYQ